MSEELKAKLAALEAAVAGLAGRVPVATPALPLTSYHRGLVFEGAAHVNNPEHAQQSLKWAKVEWREKGIGGTAPMGMNGYGEWQPGQKYPGQW
jgi:hypothetical protein